MRLIGSDPDVQTIVARIKSGDISLQPNFQRGEVWGEPKRRRLIDSILRNWHVPPIHVIELSDTAKHEVLDGQQRLAAIRDFADDKLTVDGLTEPLDPNLQQLDGRSYSELPEFWKRRFKQFTIRVFVLTDYQPDEPGELFYRLNQPTSLTAAEQRNAFFGPARQQVKDLVNQLEESGMDRELVGFSNSRMAYDDVLAKLCLTLDNRTLAEKVTASGVTTKYRSREPFSTETIKRVSRAIYTFSRARMWIRSESIRFNKATLFSWLCFLVRAEHASSMDHQDIAYFMLDFESKRGSPRMLPSEQKMYLIQTFNDRASSRVSDVSSVLLRDAILWLFFLDYCSRDYIAVRLKPQMAALRRLADELMTQSRRVQTEYLLDQFINYSDWGNLT
jgi:hypothetical protein